MELPIVVPMTVAEAPAPVLMSVSTDETLAFGLDIAVNTVAGEHYAGPTDFVPSASAQTIHTGGLIVDADIVVEPIPSNYGLITWNGSTLTVS